jgi:hypothetical protein
VEAEGKHRLVLLEKELLRDQLGEKDEGSGVTEAAPGVLLCHWRTERLALQCEAKPNSDHP